MCRYSSSCEHCEYAIEVNAQYDNLQDVRLDISSDCPNLQNITEEPITLDAMHELIVPKEKSQFMRLMDGHTHPGDCTVYKSVIDAIGKSLGRYYELA